MATKFLPGGLESVYEFCGHSFRCAYCGEPSDNIDHTVPKSLVLEKPSIGQRYCLIKVSACAECNTFAGRNIHKTFQERRLFIANKVKNKYASVLRTGDWTKSELRSLGRSLRQTTMNAIIKADWVKNRLVCLRDPIAPEGIPDDLWELRKDAEEDACAETEVHQLAEVHDR